MLKQGLSFSQIFDPNQFNFLLKNVSERIDYDFSASHHHFVTIDSITFNRLGKRRKTYTIVSFWTTSMTRM